MPRRRCSAGLAHAKLVRKRYVPANKVGRHCDGCSRMSWCIHTLSQSITFTPSLTHARWNRPAAGDLSSVQFQSGQPEGYPAACFRSDSGSGQTRCSQVADYSGGSGYSHDQQQSTGNDQGMGGQQTSDTLQRPSLAESSVPVRQPVCLDQMSVIPVQEES